MMLTSETLARHDGLRHGFFTRKGGVSEGSYASLNCGFGSGDDPDRVMANRERVAAHFGMDAPHLLTARQEHGSRIARASAPWKDEEHAPIADGLVSRSRGIALGVLTADCVPVLMADAGASVIGAVHASWRSAKGGVLENALAAMEELGARRSAIIAAAGPSISQTHYEVGLDFQDSFLSSEPWSADCFIAGAEGRAMFDLKAYARGRLERAGVSSPDIMPDCAFAADELFFSRRRLMLRDGHPRYGCQISVIALSPSDG